MQVSYLDVDAKHGKSVVVSTKSKENVFVYVISGGEITGEKSTPIEFHSAISLDKGDQLKFNTTMMED